MLRTRFAPSPTGYLHVGGTRTALFNWLYARNHNGVFILRIEDTDKKRSQKVFLDDILDSLKWLGIDWDEGPYFQSERIAIYKKFADNLLNEGKAYIDEGAIIFKISTERVKFYDLIRGEIEFDNSLINDLVIIKSDGLPTYNFACVIDDALFKITHVIRGEDHISNTPKQIPLYQSLGFDIPKFAHIPLILGRERERLSKRSGAMPISMLKEKGYLPDALFNSLSLLGWSPGGDQEIISREDSIKKFSLKRVNKTGAMFDNDKLDWMNSYYIKKASVSDLTDLIEPILLKKGNIQKGYDREWLMQVVRLYRSRLKCLSDFLTLAGFFFSEQLEYEEDAISMILHLEDAPSIFGRLIEELEKISPFNPQAVETMFRTLIKELGISIGDLIHPTRSALTGRTVSPGIFEVISLLGKEKSIRRIREAVEKVKS